MKENRVVSSALKRIKRKFRRWYFDASRKSRVEQALGLSELAKDIARGIGISDKPGLEALEFIVEGLWYKKWVNETSEKTRAKNRDY